MVDKKTRRVICTAFSNGKHHDFRVFKEYNTHIHPETTVITDRGYQGIQKRHKTAKVPKKSSKNNPLTKEDKRINQHIAVERVANENVIGALKRFKIISDRY